MATLDPFVVQWPQKWTNDPEIAPVVHYLNMYLHNLFEVTTGGSGESLIEDVTAAEKYPWPIAITPDEAKEFTYPAIHVEKQVFTSITKSESYTANDFEFINAKANALVTFPKYPCENSVIIIRNGDGSTIKLNGNGKNMNGESTGIISKKETSIEFHYFIDSDEWFAR